MSAEPRGSLLPFRRDKKLDFANGTGDELLRSKILQVLMTRGANPTSEGELPWRTTFGAGLDLLRHQRNDAALAELARVQVQDALNKWLPGVEVVGAAVVKDYNSLLLKVQYRSPGQPIGEVSAKLPDR